MRWSELDRDLTTWTLPAERVKNGVQHQIPLAPLARNILAGLPRFLVPMISCSRCAAKVQSPPAPHVPSNSLMRRSQIRSRRGRPMTCAAPQQPEWRASAYSCRWSRRSSTTSRLIRRCCRHLPAARRCRREAPSAGSLGDARGLARHQTTRSAGAARLRETGWPRQVSNTRRRPFEHRRREGGASNAVFRIHQSAVARRSFSGLG